MILFPCDFLETYEKPTYMYIALPARSRGSVRVTFSPFLPLKKKTFGSGTKCADTLKFTKKVLQQ